MLMVLGPIHVAVLPGTKAISVRSVRIIIIIDYNNRIQYTYTCRCSGPIVLY